MRRINALAWLIVPGLFSGEPATAAIRYFDISGATAASENACPVWVPTGNMDDCSFNASNPSAAGTAQWIGPVFGAGYYAPGAAPQVFTNPAPAVPVAAPAPELPLGGKTGIPIARGFISIDDKDTPETTDDVIGGTIEFGPFQRNVGTGPGTRVVESFDRIIHRIITPGDGSTNVAAATPNAGGGLDYVVGVSGGSAAFPVPLSGSTSASGGFADTFPSEVASQSSLDAADAPYWAAPGANGIANFEGATAIAGARTAATVWGYTCTAGGASPACITSDVNWDADSRARFDNVLLTVSTDDAGNITSASAYLVNESDLSSAVAGNDSWSATTLSFTGSEDPTPAAFDDRVVFINNLDLAVTVPVLINDVPGVAPVVVSIATPPSHGTATVLTQPAGAVNSIEYTPDALPFQGTDTLTYLITDANSDTSTGTLDVIRTDPGTCANDMANGTLNAPTTVDVLANDTGFDIPPVTVTIASPPAQGAATVNPNNSITFTPPTGATGFFTFGYQVTDGTNEPAQCSVTVNVDATVAVDDTSSTENFVTTDLAVLANDQQASLTAPIVIEITTPPAHGKAFVLPAAGSAPPILAYTSDAGYVGTDSLRYRLRDATGYVTNEATVTITVTDSVPVAVDDTVTVEDGVESTISVLSNDTGLHDSPLVLTLVSAPAHGTATVVPAAGATPAVFKYKPSAGYVGPDTFTYTVTDSDGDVSNTANVAVTVRDSVPIATDDSYIRDERTSVTLNVLANDSGLFDAPLTIEITSPPGIGTATVIPAADTGLGRPAIGYASNVAASGVDTLRYTVRDADGDVSNEATVTITVADTVPAAVDDTQAVEDGTSLSVNVLGNDTGLNNRPLKLTITGQPGHGTVTVNAGGPLIVPNVTYKPNAGFTGSDTFRYTVTDGDNQTSNEALVTLTVADTVPVAVDDTANGDARVSTAIDVLSNDSGLVDQPVTIEITGQPSHGTAELVTISVGFGTRPGIGYASDKGFSGTDTLTYRITDHDGDVSNDATVTFTVANPTPVAVDDVGGDPGLLPSVQRLVVERLSTPFDVLHNDTGRGNRPNIITITQPPQHGTAVVDPAEVTGRGRPGVSYRSDDGYIGPDSFRYTVTDGDDEVSNEATVTFEVVSILTAMTDGDPVPLATTMDRALTVDVLANDGGLAYGPVHVEIVTELHGTATVNADNTVTFRPSPGFTGRFPSVQCPPTSCYSSEGAGFRYRVVDSTNQSAEAAAYVDVFPPEVTKLSGGGSALDAGLIAVLLAGLGVRRRGPADDHGRT